MPGSENTSCPSPRRWCTARIAAVEDAGDHWQKRANLRAFLAYMWAHPGKQLLFMGQEFGQESEWSESRSLDWWLMDQPDHRR